jgi:hypothetical protein
MWEVCYYPAMLSIGWLMFWKAVVVGIGAGLLEIWASRVRKEQDDLTFKRDSRTGVYKAFSPFGAIDAFVRRWFWTGVVAFTAFCGAFTWWALDIQF